MIKLIGSINLNFGIIIFFSEEGCTAPSLEVLVLIFYLQNEILKTFIEFKNLIQNIQRTFDQTLHRNERISPILDSAVYCLHTTEYFLS